MFRKSRRGMAIILVVALLVGMMPAMAFAGTGETINLVGVGDSMSQGYQFLDYKETTNINNPDDNHYCGWKGASGKNYLMGIKNAISKKTGANVNVDDLSIQGLQPDELLELLKPGSVPREERSDGAQKHFAWWCLDEPAREGVDQKYDGHYIFEKKSDMSNCYINAVTNADVMVFDSGMNYFGTSLTDSVWSENEKPGDYKKILSKLNKNVVDAVDSLTKELQNYLNENGLEVFSKYMDGMLYAYVSYIYYSTECIKTIYQLNPDINLIVVGLYNPHQDLYINVKGLEVCFSDLIDLTMDSLNAYMTILNPYADKYLFADFEETPMAFVDELFYKPDHETNDLKALLKKSYSSLLGNVESNYYEEYAKTLIENQIQDPIIGIKYQSIEEYNAYNPGYTVPYNTSDWIDTCKQTIYDKYKDAFNVGPYGIIQLYMLIDGLDGMTDHFSEEYMKKAKSASTNNDIFGSVADESGMNFMMPDLYGVLKNLYNENDSLITYDETVALPVYRKALQHRTFELSTFINLMNGSGVGNYDTSRPFLEPDKATELDYLAIHWQIRFNSGAARGFGVHPSPYGIQVKSDAIQKAYTDNKTAREQALNKLTEKYVVPAVKTGAVVAGLSVATVAAVKTVDKLVDKAKQAEAERKTAEDAKMAEEAAKEAARLLEEARTNAIQAIKEAAGDNTADIVKSFCDSGYDAINSAKTADEIMAATVEYVNLIAEAKTVLGTKLCQNKLKAYKNSKIKVSFENPTIEGVVNYTVIRSTKKDFSKNLKTYTVKAKSQDTLGRINSKKLKKGTKYYYKVRANVQLSDGSIVSTDWSNTRSAVCKKTIK